MMKTSTFEVFSPLTSPRNCPNLNLYFNRDSAYPGEYASGGICVSNAPPKETTCMILYRWLADGGKRERGRIMARLVSEILRSLEIPVWLDQNRIDVDAGKEEVYSIVGEAFKFSKVIVFLAAPGDWDRFADPDDIHRWEWEVAIESGKPIFVLLHETTDISQILAERHRIYLGAFAKTLDKALKEKINLRPVTTRNIDDVLREIMISVNERC